MYALRSSPEDRDNAMFHLGITGALLFALSLDAGASGTAPVVRAISLERDCNGCPSGTRLTLHADGRAQLETLGKERLGTASQLREGRLPTREFMALARLARSRSGVLSLAENQADPQEQDGPWLTLRIEYSDGQARQVFSRGAQPPALAKMVSAIDAAGHRIVFNTPPE